MHLSGFQAIGGGQVTASRVSSFLGLYSWNENFELTNQLTSDNHFQSDRKMPCIHTTSRIKIWPAAYHLSNAYCYCKMIRCYNLVAVKMQQKIKYIFLVFSERKFRKVKRTFWTPSRQPLNRFSWNLASLLSDSFFSKTVSAISVFFFRFWIIVIFSEEVLMICPLWLYPSVTKEQMHVSKIWDTVF